MSNQRTDWPALTGANGTAILEVFPAVDSRSEAELASAVRAGGHDAANAYAELYVRNVGAARHLARQLARCRADVEDLVSVAFAKVLRVLTDPHGPVISSFRAYLLTTLRHAAYDWTRRAGRLELAAEVADVRGVRIDAVSEPFQEVTLVRLEYALVRRAFAGLPRRWQLVLWLTEVRELSVPAIAPLLGLSPNGVAALAYRAREGLRREYLQLHITRVRGDERCRATVGSLGAWSRGGLATRAAAEVRAHLAECGGCAALAAELAEVAGTLCRPAA